ncbi:MAG: DUF1016 domain-containing protein, partial [Clostridia bacterium]|nr:DUF1016 domain-containing protein [Clostridia bacterium]
MAGIINKNDLDQIVTIIESSRIRAVKAVNREMIDMYWNIGRYLSKRIEDEGWGKGVVREFADFLNEKYPSSGGFSAQNLWRMKQFYET